MPLTGHRAVLALFSVGCMTYEAPMVMAIAALTFIAALLPRACKYRNEARVLKTEVEEHKAKIGALNKTIFTLRLNEKVMDLAIVDLQRELEEARSTPKRIEGAGHPLYRKVGLDQDCPEFVARAVRRAYRSKLHPDVHPAHRKDEAERRFKVAEQAFDEIWTLRGFK